MVGAGEGGLALVVKRAHLLDVDERLQVEGMPDVVGKFLLERLEAPIAIRQIALEGDQGGLGVDPPAARRVEEGAVAEGDNAQGTIGEDGAQNLALDLAVMLRSAGEGEGVDRLARVVLHEAVEIVKRQAVETRQLMGDAAGVGGDEAGQGEVAGEGDEGMIVVVALHDEFAEDVAGLLLRRETEKNLEGNVPPPTISVRRRPSRARKIPSMRIHILAFATAGDVLGSEAVGLVLGVALVELYPDLEPLWPRLAVAVDGELVRGDAGLVEGAEVALLPPVSGGSPDVAVAPPTSVQRAALVDEPIDVAAVEGAVAGPRSGAVLLFLGTVRDHHRGRSVHQLTYTAYRAMAEAQLVRIVDDLETGDEVRAAIVHRLGNVPVGEASVVIAVASPHRQAAYAASREALERLKREVPIWKREHYADGESMWREEEPLSSS